MVAIKGHEISVGCDPEVFVKSVKTGRFVCGHGLIPGTKDVPFKIANGMVQVDGMAFEFGIDPAKNRDEFVNRVNAVLDTLRGMAPAYTIEIVPVAQFTPAVLRNSPKEALELGCDPDYNAYTGKANPRPDGGAVNYRTGSGHVHIGWTKAPVDPFHPEHFKACLLLAKQLDVYLGVPSLLWDKDKDRRRLYGRAGAFRPKSYGMEYRTPSNQWLKHDTIKAFVFDQTVRAVGELFGGNFAPDKVKDAERIINDSDLSTAVYYTKSVMNFEPPKPPADMQRKKEAA